jgi:hypothetical protein
MYRSTGTEVCKIAIERVYMVGILYETVQKYNMELRKDEKSLNPNLFGALWRV